MHGGNNPWISIADLLSGFVVIVLILFITAAALPRFPPAAPELSPEQRAANLREEHRRAFLHRIGENLAPYAAQGLLRVDESRGLIELSDVSFASGSACMTEQAKRAVEAIAPVVRAEVARDPDLHVHVEGHCDPSPVRGVTKACGWFANNTQLSALRATNVRDIIVADSTDEARGRMAVTGWGADRLRNRKELSAAENRRVELHISWRDASPAGVPDAGASAL